MSKHRCTCKYLRPASGAELGAGCASVPGLPGAGHGSDLAPSDVFASALLAGDLFDGRVSEPHAPDTKQKKQTEKRYSDAELSVKAL